MEIDRMERYQHPFTIAYIDLDNFKSVNDKLGHATGDRVLHTLAESVRIVSRKTDIFARIGGDEFALLLPETNQEQAQIILPKVEAHLVREMRKHNWPVTFSIGVLTCLTATHSADEIMQRADKLMYKAKRDHKNTIKYATLEAG